MQNDRFEWDDRKAAANRRKHGISFELARVAFEDTEGQEDLDDSDDEERVRLIGMALGINDPRHGKSRGYGYGLVALLLYYLLVRIGDATGEKGTVSPEIAAWTPNVVFAALGIWLFMSRAAEKDTFIERLWARIAQ